MGEKRKKEYIYTWITSVVQVVRMGGPDHKMTSQGPQRWNAAH